MRRAHDRRTSLGTGAAVRRPKARGARSVDHGLAEVESTSTTTEQAMVQYVPAPLHDMYLSQWWYRLNEIEELGQMFTDDAFALSNFFIAFRIPTTLFFLLDGGTQNRRIIAAAWFEPNGMGSAFAGTWIDPDHRSEKLARRITLETLQKALTVYPVVMYVTKSTQVKETLLRYGGSDGGDVPKAYDGKTARMVYCTRKRFAKIARQHGLDAPDMH